MRGAFRVGMTVLFFYLLQATCLPLLKVNGTLIDALDVSLFAVGSALGLYAGFCAGLLAAIFMEVLGGDLSGMTSLVCVAMGVVGALSERRVNLINLSGKRTKERILKRFLPPLTVAIAVAAKETLFFAYFYLTGVDLSWWHAGRMLVSGTLAGLLALVLLPIMAKLLTRVPQKSLLSRLLERKSTRGKPKPIKIG